MKFNKIVIAAALTLASTAAIADTFKYDAMECRNVAQKFVDNQFKMAVGDLDTLALCANTMRDAKVRAAQDEKEINTFERLNSRGETERKSPSAAAFDNAKRVSALRDAE